MTGLFAIVAVLASVSAQSAAAAFSRRLWPSLAAIALGALLLLMSSVFDWLASVPSDSLARALASSEMVEGLALAICLESFVGAYLLWRTTAASSRFSGLGLLVPFPSTIAAALALAQISMARGPRIDLELLGWAAIAGYVVTIAVVALLARRIARTAADFLLEMCLLLRFVAVLSAAAMIAALHNRPAPVLEFEPVGVALVLVLCTALIGFGYFRKINT